MRKIILSEFISLDGVIEDPGGSENFRHGGWTWPFHNTKIEKFKYNELLHSDGLILGKVTYNGFAKAWPKMKDTGNFGIKMNNMPKYVISTTLKKANWNNSIIINKNTIKEIRKLKNQPGNSLLIFGSSKLSQSLIKNGLIDEFNLLVYPILLGSGKRLFENINDAPLILIESKEFDSGVILLKYKLNNKKVKYGKNR